MHLTNWQILWGVFGALCVGLSKGGISGLGIAAAPLFALVFPPMESTGLVLVILICADFVSVALFRRHAAWGHIKRLFPFAATGVVAGYFVYKWLRPALPASFKLAGIAQRHFLLVQQKAQLAHGQKEFGFLMGAILLALVGVQIWRKEKTKGDEEKAARLIPHNWWIVATFGVLAGFTTMLANAAGPVMIIYLLAMRLPKLEFIGTSAWYFLTLNLFKVPFSYDLGLINPASLKVDAWFAPVAMLSVPAGRWLLKFIDQELFERLALGFTVLAALKLLAGV